MRCKSENSLVARIPVLGAGDMGSSPLFLSDGSGYFLGR